MVKFTETKHETAIIHRIAERASRMAASFGVPYPVFDATLDVSACHSNGCALRLADLLAADDTNFAHDVFGIRNAINRDTGALENCFRPRFALRR